MTDANAISRGHPVRYWRQNKPWAAQNFGDYLTELFLDRLMVLPSFPADAYHLVGSVITSSQIEEDLQNVNVPLERGCVAFWGCGMRDENALPAWAKSKARFFGVRGPLTRDGLNLPPDTILGDPGLLAPILHPSPPSGEKGDVLCIIHILDPQNDEDILRRSGADRVVRAGIPGTIGALCSFLEMIAQADFILAGALHGAIVASAYGVPFAYYDSGFIDIPFKWRDFAASVEIDAEFAKNIREGRVIYEDMIRQRYSRLPLTPILAGAPFSVRHHMLARALHADGHIDDPTLKRLIRTYLDNSVDLDHPIRTAQTIWAEARHR